MINPEELEPEYLAGLIRRTSSLTGTALLVALFLGFDYDPELGYTKTSMRTLASGTGKSLNTVRAALKEIEESGEWEPVGSGGLSRYAPNLDMLVADNSDQRASSRKQVPSNPSARASNFTSRKKETESSPATEEVLEEVSSDSADRPFILDDAEQMHAGNIRAFTEMRDARSYARRLRKNTDITTRSNKAAFSVTALTSLYQELLKSHPAEAVDTLLTYQCETGGALSGKFIEIVLGRIAKKGKLVEPQKYAKEPESSGAYLTARAVWNVMEARKKSPPASVAPAVHPNDKEYKESL